MKEINALPSQEYLKECIYYNPDTGEATQSLLKEFANFG
jgi:hypothetical protein